ncbi:AAA+-type ATPase, SpoVK/Ycf46/Vps4 family (plasmid) [Nostoc flagelliforme CCNUN1]|uniref:AAA+-type ATPase, SpoVK/Ycf46/Vps4 family n=1 Tax=Nostoc flagelliforme CCNUN1 TaxID=2038116 RepID=A0A2K8T8B4_9NOSO|nr:hypothetical protein [Nostoc flagelliforme]AUB43947.1 AAA+-type ATPase, SpoVK/Ycf46/Vps4 family [Nostoc flagelliforme CCNUN1]
MKLSNLLSTLDSQIPIAAVDVLSPDEATIIQWLTTEANNKLSCPVELLHKYFVVLLGVILISVFGSSNSKSL